MRTLSATWLLALAACSSPATQVVVVVDTDLSVGDQIRGIRAVIKNEAGEAITEQIFGLDRARSEEVQVSLPFSFTVVPGEDVEAPIRVELEPLGPDGNARYTWRSLTGFIAEKTLRLDAFLASDCGPTTCAAGQTCEATGCRSEIFEASALPAIEPGTELEGHQRPDAGTSDGGPTDGARPDTGPDGGEPDGGEPDGGRPDSGPLPDGGPPPDAGFCAPVGQQGMPCGDDTFYCCGGECIDTANSATACGPTCIDCGGNAECVDGVCGCTAPFENCDPFPGCEANLNADPDNCMHCGTECRGSTPSCISGECRACESASDCLDDGLSCTQQPECNDGNCEYPVFPDTCLIAGACYNEGEINATNSCLGCEPMASASDWSPRDGMTCTDGLFCTQTDTCDATGVCGGTGSPCSDNLACTSDTCSETNGCGHTIATNNCVINNVCRTSGQTMAGNPCLACVPNDAQNDWSPNFGAPCNDGNYCTATDVCNASAVCSGGGTPCDDGLTCTIDACNEATDMCAPTMLPGTCLIDGACYVTGDRSPGNECEICDPSINPSVWVSAPSDSYTCGGQGICCNGNCSEPGNGACGSCNVDCGFNGQCNCFSGSAFQCYCCTFGIDC